MSDSMKIGPAGVGLCGALAGGALGYFGAPYKYELQQIITQDDAAFKQVFTDDVFQKSQGIKKTALDKIVKARETMAKAKANGTFDAELGESLCPELKKAYDSVKESIPKVRGQSMLAGALILGLLTLGVSFLFVDSGKYKKN